MTLTPKEITSMHGRRLGVRIAGLGNSACVTPRYHVRLIDHTGQAVGEGAGPSPGWALADALQHHDQDRRS
jgi:hypothetical protein